MITAGIKEIKLNPSLITKAVEDKDEYLFISKRGKPIAVALSLDNNIFNFGFKKWILIKAYKKGDLSLGQLSKALDKPYIETMKMLSLLDIDILDYDLDEELKTIEKLS
jgi:predicted HTH domain antitoxin